MPRFAVILPAAGKSSRFRDRDKKPFSNLDGRAVWLRSAELFVSRDLVRLRKSPPPRRDSWAARAPNSLVCAWFFVLAATAESMPPKVALPHFVTEARVAAAEAGVPAKVSRSIRAKNSSALRGR